MERKRGRGAPFLYMFDSQGRGNAGLKAGNSMQAGGGPVAEQVRDDLGRLASADGDEVAVGHAELDLGIGCLVGIEELELDAALGEDVLAGLGQVIEDEHGGAKVNRGHFQKSGGVRWLGSCRGWLGMCFARMRTQRV